MTDWDKVARQTQGYRELDEFKPGDSLHLQYFPVPEEELARHQKHKDKLAMQKYEQELKEKEETKKALLELRTEDEPRENGHHEPATKVIFREETLTHGFEINKICKDCEKHTIFCECNKSKNPSHCDLKNKQQKVRKSKKK